MEQHCEHCKCEQTGYKTIINREQFFHCLTCKKDSTYIPFVHPNRNERYAGIVAPDFPGSHNAEYGR